MVCSPMPVPGGGTCMLIVCMAALIVASRGKPGRDPQKIHNLEKLRVDRPGRTRQAIYQYPGCVIPLPYQGMEDEIVESHLKPGVSR